MINKFKISEYLSPQARNKNQENMKATHFSLGSERQHKRMSETFSHPITFIPEQSKQHIVMANRSKKVVKIKII